MVDQNSKPIFEPQRRRTPIHYWLGTYERSIILKPLERPQESKDIPRTISSSEDVQSSGCRHHVPNSIPPVDSKYPQVLLSFRLSADGFDVQAWLDWVLNAPKDAADLVRIEGIYGSQSTVVILQVPVSIWDMMPESDAIKFIDFITTDNIREQVVQEIDKETHDKALSRPLCLSPKSACHLEPPQQPEVSTKPREWRHSYSVRQKNRYEVENRPYIQEVAERRPDENPLSHFFVGTGIRMEKLRGFWSGVDLQTLRDGGGEAGVQQVACLDQRSKSGGSRRGNRQPCKGPLTATQLYKALTKRVRFNPTERQVVSLSQIHKR